MFDYEPLTLDGCDIVINEDPELRAECSRFHVSHKGGGSIAFRLGAVLSPDFPDLFALMKGVDLDLITIVANYEHYDLTKEIKLEQVHLQLASLHHNDRTTPLEVDCYFKAKKVAGYTIEEEMF